MFSPALSKYNDLYQFSHTVIAWHDAENDTLNLQGDAGPITSLAYSGGSLDTIFPLTVGAFADSTYVLNGRVDELALYRRLLTADERAWLHNSGQGRAYSDLPTPTTEPCVRPFGFAQGMFSPHTAPEYTGCCTQRVCYHQHHSY